MCTQLNNFTSGHFVWEKNQVCPITLVNDQQTKLDWTDSRGVYPNQVVWDPCRHLTNPSPKLHSALACICKLAASESTPAWTGKAQMTQTSSPLRLDFRWSDCVGLCDTHAAVTLGTFGCRSWRRTTPEVCWRRCSLARGTTPEVTTCLAANTYHMKEKPWDTGVLASCRTCPPRNEKRRGLFRERWVPFRCFRKNTDKRCGETNSASRTSWAFMWEGLEFQCQNTSKNTSDESGDCLETAAGKWGKSSLIHRDRVHLRNLWGLNFQQHERVLGNNYNYALRAKGSEMTASARESPH